MHATIRSAYTDIFRLTPIQQSGLNIRADDHRAAHRALSLPVMTAPAHRPPSRRSSRKQSPLRTSKNLIPANRGTENSRRRRRFARCHRTIKDYGFPSNPTCKNLRRHFRESKSGVIAGKRCSCLFANPHVELCDPMSADAGLFTIPDAPKENTGNFSQLYAESKGVTSCGFSHATELVIKAAYSHHSRISYRPCVPAEYHLPDSCYRQLHGYIAGK